MFHMLGRFAFTSFFSRRSSRGFRVGSRRFGFCCCDRGLPNVLIISHPFHLLFAINAVIAAAQSQHRPARRSLAMFRNPTPPVGSPFCVPQGRIVPVGDDKSELATPKYHHFWSTARSWQRRGVSPQ